MFNLIVDGGIGAVWGIRQLRTGLLTDIKQVEDGIPQGATLSVRDDTPDGVKVLEQVSTTPDGVITTGMQVLELLMREYNQASLTNDIQMGSLPMRQVKATEIVSANQSNSVTLSSISSDLELVSSNPFYANPGSPYCNTSMTLIARRSSNASGKKPPSFCCLLPRPSVTPCSLTPHPSKSWAFRAS